VHFLYGDPILEPMMIHFDRNGELQSARRSRFVNA
jgi:hypothetical protein